MNRVGLRGLGVAIPERIMTNADLERIVETSDEWIRARTGIRERRIAPKGTPSSALGTQAALEALRDAQLDPREVELVIVATTSPDMICPSTASMVQKNIGATKAAAFDVLAACSGFVYGLGIAHGFVKSGMYRHVLVIAAEVLSSMIDWTDRSTCVLFGDGAGAAVVGTVSRGGILAHYVGSDGSCGDLLEIPAGGSRIPATHESVDQHLHTLKMKGNEVFKWAVRRMVEAAQTALQQAKLTIKDIACVIPHQANSRIIDAVAKRLQLGRDQLFVNVDRYGNVSAASTIIALYEAVKQGRVNRGDKVLIITFGSGLTWGSCILEW